MMIIALVWRDHQNNLKAEKFDGADFHIKTEPGWLKLLDKNGIFRMIPSDKIHIIEFAEEADKSPIISPHENIGPMAVPKNFQES